VAEIEFSWVSDTAGLVAPVYMGHAYQTMLSRNDGSDARLLKCRTQSATSYLPMLIKDLGDNCKEAYSAYGYGGLLGNLTLSEPEADQLRRFLASESILAIFIRHSPFLSNQAQWPSVSTELNRYTYSAALQPSDSFETFLTGIPQKLRWSVNYAYRAGLRVTFHSLAHYSTDRISAFYQLYSELMHQKQTSAYYLFSEDFFVQHAHALHAQCELAEIHDEENGNLLAGAFFLLDETGWVHYHLSAATPSAMKLQGMELLMASALQRYGNSGYRNMHLGGGHALDESDGLSRFKSKYSTERLDFFCTKLVCDVGSYQSVRAKIPLKNPAYFLISDARGQ
jgi:serine/alanine adding enzyme